MKKIVQSMAGMAGMTDQVIATDYLITAKSTVRNTAFALTESASPEVRNLLRKQLSDAIESHEKISQYMLEKGFYYPSNLDEQLKVEMKSSDAAIKLTD